MTLTIKSRSEWGARHGRGADASRFLPWGEAVVHTEAGAVRPGDWPEITEAARLMSLSEQQHIQAIERYHSVTLGWNGIGYSFLISRDGTIFEGRGWGRSGAHTETRNSTALGICFLGHGDLQPATEAQWIAARWLIAEGIRLGHITPNPKITGHRNYSTKGKTCPGNLIYPHIHDRLGGITGHQPHQPSKGGFLMSLSDEQQLSMYDTLNGLREMNIPLINIRLTEIEARLERIEHHLNIDGHDKDKDGHARPSYPIRILWDTNAIRKAIAPQGEIAPTDGE